MELNHIAFIMDGNGRWAVQRGKPREFGHKYGAENFKRVIRYCGDIGIKIITVYVFSTENWTRPKKEVDTIMALFRDYLDDALRNMMENDIRIKFIGDRSVFRGQTLKLMNDIERDSAYNNLLLNLAVNYGGKAEIVNAVNSLISDGYTSVTEADIESRLYTYPCPPPDLIVRTGADGTAMRLSNFLLWQSTYSELYFTNVLWPDFSNNDVDAAVSEFQKRKRRYGGV